MVTKETLTVIALILGDTEDKVSFSQKFGLATEIHWSKTGLLKKPLVDLINICQQGINYTITD